MKYLTLLPLGIAFLTVSCKSDKVASTNPYQNNPYYGPSGSTYGSTTDYSSTSSSYPSYSQSAYTPPTTTSGAASTPNVPSVPETPTYSSTVPSYSGTSMATTNSTPASVPASSGSSHTVAGGENLYRISVAHGTSVAAIKSANGLASDTIHPGQVLRIP